MSVSNRIVTIFGIAVFLCGTFAYGSGENPYRIGIPLDGYNTTIYNVLFPWDSWNFRSTILGTPGDRYPRSRLETFGRRYSGVPDTSDTAILATSASIGAETGEPLLNKLDDPNLPNRDHFTLFETSLDVPKIPLRLTAGYRYLDTYSDRFDSLWADYSARVPGPGPAFSSEGLAHDVAFAYHYEPTYISLNGAFYRYGYWGVTPYYYSPLHTRGYRIAQSASKGFSGLHLDLDMQLDFHDDYQDLQTPVEYRDWSAQFTAVREITSTARLGLTLHRDTKIRPRTYAQASIYDTSKAERFGYAMYVRAFSNYKTGFGAKLSIPVYRGVYGDARAAWRYRISPRDHFFYQKATRVEYSSREWHQRLLHFGLRYDDRRKPVFKARLFYSFLDEPGWERVNIEGEVVKITLDTISEGFRHYWGAAGYGTYGRGPLRLNWSIFGATTPTDDTVGLPLEIPWRVAAEAEYESRKRQGARIGVRAEIRDRVSQRYYLEDTESIEIRTAPSRATVALYAKLPFHPPVFREHVKPWIVFETHPITVPSEFSLDGLKDQRRRSHPGGNYRGPLILVRLEGVWR